MQVLGGLLRGRKIEAPARIRPISQRVKKSCFDIMSGQIKARSVLDLYAGSGSLGIEALSRGAKRAVFVDIDRSNLKLLEKNLINLGIMTAAKTYCQDSCLAIKSFYQKKISFSLIFLDPPYNKNLLTKSLQLLESYDILARFGYLVGFCYKKEAYSKKYKRFSLVLQRNYGQSMLLVYKKVDYD